MPRYLERCSDEDYSYFTAQNFSVMLHEASLKAKEVGNLYEKE